MAGRMAAAEIMGEQWDAPPQITAHGALLQHITGGAMADSFQPMNVNFGLFPELEASDNKTGKRKLKGRDRKAAFARRALLSMQGWSGNTTLDIEALFAPDDETRRSA